MTNRQLIALYGVTLLAVSSLSMAWEFTGEDIVGHIIHEAPEPETHRDRWEFVITSTFFAAVAMIVPAFLISSAMRKRRAAEEAYRRSENILRAFVNHAPALVALKHTDGRYLLMNREYSTQLGLDPASTEGKDAHSLFPTDLAEEFADQERTAVETKAEVTREHVIPHQDGDHVHLCTKFPVMDDNGDVLGIGTFSTDITAQKATEMRIHSAMRDAEQANHAKSQFLANMSHELRTPLNSIIGFSQIMAITPPLGPTPDKHLEYAQDIQRSAEHLLELINDLLDLSKIEAGQLTLHIEDVVLPEILANACRMLETNAQAKSLTVDRSWTGDLPTIQADPRFLTQIFLNLLSNAVKFNRPGGRIDISCSAEPNGGIAIAIADTGIGIEAKDIPQVLEPFVQADAAAHRAREGTGLGLSVSKKLVELHGGTLAIESTPDIGTTVTVKLPERQPAAA